MILRTLLATILAAGFFGVSNIASQSSPLPAAETRIEWNPASLTLVQPGGNYARIARLPNRQLACAFEWRTRIFLRTSADKGKSWGAPTPVAAWPLGSLSNPELLSQRNGTLLCFYNQRPRRGNRPDSVNAAPAHFGIALSRSTDGGITWDVSTTLFQAGTDGGTGCWEPAAIEIPNGVMTGEIQLFFANEFPYPDTNEQQISLLRSLDGGRTWTGPQAASFRSRCRDGMPVPVVLRDGQGIAVAMEDNGFGGLFKPGIFFSDLATNWRGGPVLAGSPRRWGALATPLPPATYAGAPYLRQMPTGETVLSYQQGDNAVDLRSARMAVCVGDAHARNFGAASFPFPVTPGRGQLWNSLFVKDAQTVTAVTGAFINGTGGIWTMDGRLMRLDATSTAR